VVLKAYSIAQVLRAFLPDLLPANRYEAATLDGVSFWCYFWYIKLPTINPTLVLAIVTTNIFSLRSFEQVFAKT
jgi:multiple sugar transport system permease protein